MSVTDLIVWGLVGGGGSGAVSYGCAKVNSLRKKKAELASQPEKIDGRTHEEWYELLKVMTREEYEALSRPALDGLEESEYGWDVKRLLGPHYDKLMQGWYPDKFCKYCKAEFNKNGDCMWDGPCHVRFSAENAKFEKSRIHGMLKERKYIAPDDVDYLADTIKVNKNQPEVNITEIRFKAQPGLVKWQVTHGDVNFIVGRIELMRFQKYKSLPLTGKMDSATRACLTVYLKVGNPWPISEGRLRSEEAKKLSDELVRWSKAGIKPAPSPYRYKKNGY